MKGDKTIAELALQFEMNHYKTQMRIIFKMTELKSTRHKLNLGQVLA
jgi:hypothetical protein